MLTGPKSSCVPRSSATQGKLPQGSSVAALSCAPDCLTSTASSVTAAPQAALTSGHGTGCAAVRPRRSRLMVPNGPENQMRKASFRTFARRSAAKQTAPCSSCAAVASRSATCAARRRL